MLKYHIVNISLLTRYQTCEGFQLCAADAARHGEHACGCVCELLAGSGSAGTRMG